MSAYENFIKDYPGRCARILDLYFTGAKDNGIEVTLLLNVASSGLIIPFERLKSDEQHCSHQHPLGDAQRFRDAKERLDAALNSPFLGSKLHPLDTPGSWKIGHLKDITGESDSWAWEELRQITNKKTAKPILKILRNALAHGNIVTLGRTQITELAFLSVVDHKKPESGFDCVRVSPIDFKDFVSNWLQFLARAHIPSQVVAESTAFAEI